MGKNFLKYFWYNVNECYESCNCLSYTRKLHPQISSLALFVSKIILMGMYAGTGDIK